jgi:branched-chain amino acid transport system ATP-binding protein
MTGELLGVTDLTVRFGGVLAVDGITLTVERGEICGLIGPNGAGKTTFLDAVSGFVAPSDGEIVLDGDDCTGEPPHRLARRGLTRTFQSLELFDDISVVENLLVAATRTRWWFVVRDALGLGGATAPERARVHEVLGDLGLEDVADELPRQLSNGRRHRVAIARAVVSSPRLLLLDEPAAGLDPAETAELAGLLRAIRESGTTILLVDHDMSLVMDVCDRIHVLDQGRVIATGAPEEIRSAPAVVAAYLGGDVGS